MKKTPSGTSVGVDDPYRFVSRCDHLTDDGRCRFAAEQYGSDPEFCRARQADDLRCPAADPDGEWEWRDCPHFRARNRDRECARCGLEERRMAHSGERPLLEEHHLEYADRASRSDAETAADGVSHEITVSLCRWCYAKVHDSWARITDDASPDPEAVAAAEERRGRELDELGFESAADRHE
ncbi:MAG: hypothetical protein ABEJ06_06125 [Haloarculaceae archaeon]